MSWARRARAWGAGDGGEVFGLLLGGAAAAGEEGAGVGGFEDVEQLGEGEVVAARRGRGRGRSARR
ncbi:MAG: hypothetical protein HND58_05020 [Planctomycetota bacterium]|nr:MAG: hypothetical protein HND58_05020 [Planctomycetota bacterium]